MTFALARSLLLADAVTPDALAEALLVSATRGTSLVRALLTTRAIDPVRLEHQLEKGDAPYMRHVAPVMSLVQQLPPGLCERLLALPVRRDERTGTVDVAVVDARDPHAVEEIAHWLKSPVRMVRTSLVSMEGALRRMQSKPEVGVHALAAPIWVPSATEAPKDLAQTPAYGSPAMDEAQLVETIADDAVEDDDAAVDDDDDAKPTHVTDIAAAVANIPFALTRKSLAPVSIVEIGEPAIEREPQTDPVLDLRRRKSAVSPIAPNAPSPPFAEAVSVLEAMDEATDRDSILELLVSGTRSVARKIAVLAVKRDYLLGWTCSPELGEQSVIRAARVRIAMSSVFSRALEAESALLARIPKDATHAPLLAAMKTPPSGEVALASVRVEGKAVALLLADELGDTLVATRRMEDLAHAAGDALARLLRERRKT
jgi:hypothetical protein